MSYKEGFRDGWNAAQDAALAEWQDARRMSHDEAGFPKPKSKRKKPQKGKAKLLTDMTAPKWKKYKKGNGKKTYVDIRAQVSRSQDYKKACKRKGFK